MNVQISFDYWLLLNIHTLQSISFGLTWAEITFLIFQNSEFSTVLIKFKLIKMEFDQFTFFTLYPIFWACIFIGS